MWPKALAQLIELAPHISRLVPLADRFLQGKNASEETSRRAMDAMAEGLRGDLGQVTAAHAGLYHQLIEQSEKLTAQSEKLAAVAEDARSARQAAEALEFRLNHAEARLQRLTVLAGASLVLLVGAVVLLVLLLSRTR